MKRKIIIFSGRYLPGHKDGGPLRTLINVTDALGDEYDFHIACLDRDHGDTETYSDIRINEWNQVGKAKVRYVPPGGFTDELILNLVHGMDIVYLCSFFDDYGYKTLLLHRRGQITVPVFVASMGVFADGAMSRKTVKKKAFIAGCKALGLFNNITWSVTSGLEADEMMRIIGKKAKYVIAEDLPRTNVPGRTEPQHNPMRVVFLSRICAHKGLDLAIDAIKQSRIKCQFTIYGPIQEAEYWEMCKAKIAGMEWNYGGDVPPEEVQERLSHHDVFILPTKSENYGHVVFEALSVGCIPVISDTTPWSLGGAGFVASRNAARFSEALQRLETVNRDEMSKKAVELALKKVADSKAYTGYRAIFG